LFQPLGNLTHCKFTNESKSEAYLKFANVQDGSSVREKVEEIAR
jgi:hypothetical protein